MLFFFAFLVLDTLRSQDTIPAEKLSRSKYVEVGIEGMLGFSVGKNFYALNVGGPNLLLTLGKHWKIGICALPSLYLFNGKLGARLGVSPRVDFKSFVIFAPFYHREATNQWIWSLGLGYKFHKKKKVLK